MLAEPVRSELLQGRGHRGVQPGTSLGELRAVRHVAHQGMLERILRPGGRRDQAHEFPVLERAEGDAEIVTVQTADLSEEGLVELLADHRGGLQEVLGLLVEPIDARGQERLHRLRKSEGIDRRHQAIGAALPDEAPGRRQRVHHLFGEERVAPGALADEIGHLTERAVRAE